jgi:hypothetical protein
MKKNENNITLILLVITCLFFSLDSYSQKNKKPIQYRFKGGETAYSAFFSKSVRYPQASVHAGAVGNSITRISINPAGELNRVEIINPIDSNIDNEVLMAIDQSRLYWQRCDSINHDQVFFIQVSFSLPGVYPALCRPKKKELAAFFPEPVLINLPESLLATLSKGNEGNKNVIKNDELMEKANAYLDSAKYEEALPYIDEAIKRDPFTRGLYKLRIMINVKLNRPELVARDDDKISDFAEGFSINDINMDQE